MIKIIIKSRCKSHQGTDFVSLTVSGHANSAPHGEDLVCAAVSGIVLGGINAFDEGDIVIKSDEKSGEIIIERGSRFNEHDYVVIETIVKQLEAVARDNAKFIKIEHIS